MSNIWISPSILASDFSNLGREITRVEQAGADCIHLDVMDGVFVPNISFGIPVVSSIRKTTALPFDLHLMIIDPLRYIEDFAKAGADLISFHLESHSDPLETIRLIHSLGKKAGLSISPKTPAEAMLPYLDQLDLALIMSVEPGFGGQSFMDCCLDKIRTIRAAAPNLRINVDGGINEKTGALCREAGADMLVAGSYVFKSKDIPAAISSLRN